MDEELTLDNLFANGCVVTLGFLGVAGGGLLVLWGERPILDVIGSILAVFSAYFLVAGFVSYLRLARVALREWRRRRAARDGEAEEEQPAGRLLRLGDDRIRIRRHFKLGDETIYRWRLSVSDSSDPLPRGSLEGAVGVVAVFLVLGTLFAVIGYTIYWWLGEWISHQVSFVFAAVQASTWLAGIGVAYGASRAHWLPPLPANTRAMRRLVFPVFALGSILYLLNSPVGYIRAGFVGVDGTGIGQWGLFLLDNVLDILLLDILDVYELHLSPIVPVSFWARFLTVVLKVLVLGLLVDVMVENLKAARADRVFYGTTAECAVAVNDDVGALEEVIKEGRVTLYKRRIAADSDAFSEAFEGYLYR
jgi:hypothetical protein